MLLDAFLKNHPIPLTDAERHMCDEAIEIMKRAADVHHDHTHIFRLLGYLDEFIATPDFQNIRTKVDLKVIFISIICHDLWRSKKDAHTMWQLLWFGCIEYFYGPAIFSKIASKYSIPKTMVQKINYCIKKHAQFTIFSPRTIEARVLKAIDEVDHYSDARIAVLEKKFLVDRPITRFYYRQAQAATWLFVETNTAALHYFPSVKSIILAKKRTIADRLWSEIEDYGILLGYKNNKNHEAYQRQFELMKQKFNLS